MTDLNELRGVLEDYFSAVASQKTGQPLDLAPSIEALDRIGKEMPTHWPARLRHFMEAKSYTKARAFLKDESA